MRILVVHSHPAEEGFSKALYALTLETLRAGGHEVRGIDLYGENFAAVMSTEEWRGRMDKGANEVPVAEHLEHLRWAEGLIFVYPTWWYGLPAMLKGWLERVWVAHVTFILPEDGGMIRPGMTHIRLVGGITTYGSPWWLIRWVGDCGRRTLLGGIGTLCDRRRKTFWLGHYSMDSSTPKSRAAFMAHVKAKLARI